MSRAGGSRDARAYEDAVAIAEEAERRGYHFDRAAAGTIFGGLLAEGVAAAVTEPTGESCRRVTRLAQVGARLGLADRFGRAQELLYAVIERGVSIDDEVRELAAALSLAISEVS